MISDNDRASTGRMIAVLSAMAIALIAAPACFGGDARSMDDSDVATNAAADATADSATDVRLADDEAADRDTASSTDSADAESLDSGTPDSADDAASNQPGETGVSWDQTHIDTSWLFDADRDGTLSIERVTTLDRTGAGSLTAALTAAEDNANTLIVFEVGGVIDNGGTTYVRTRADNLYIAGQTAPYPGITLIRGGLRVHGSNTIVQHMTFLPGDDIDEPHKARAITYDSDGSNILIDHCTAGWAPDTNVNVLAGEGRAFINSINAEALNESSHPEAPHGYGTRFAEEVTNATFMGNLRMHNWKRNPMSNQTTTRFAWLNNYTYNWGARIFHGSSRAGPEMDWIGNVVEAGDDTDIGAGAFGGHEATVYYADSLLIPADTPLNDDNVTYVDQPFDLPDGLSPSDLVPPAELEAFLLPSVGPRPADRAPHEQRLIDDFVNREGKIIDHQDDVGGYPSYEPSSRPLDPPNSDVLEWLQQYTDEVESS